MRKAPPSSPEFAIPTVSADGLATGSAVAGWLIAGLGSGHGDDQVGWWMADTLATADAGGPLAPRVVKLRSASELLHYLDAFGGIIVCDACRGSGPFGQLHRWRWPHVPALAQLGGGSHDLRLPGALALAEQLGARLPPLEIWAIEIEAPLAGAPMSSRLARRLPALADRLRRELRKTLVERVAAGPPAVSGGGSSESPPATQERNQP